VSVTWLPYVGLVGATCMCSSRATEIDLGEVLSLSPRDSNFSSEALLSDNSGVIGPREAFLLFGDGDTVMLRSMMMSQSMMMS